MFNTFRGMITWVIVLMLFLMAMSVMMVLSTYRASSLLSTELGSLSAQKESITGIYLDFLEIKTKGLHTLLDKDASIDFDVEEKKTNIYDNLATARKSLSKDKSQIDNIKTTLDDFFANYDRILENQKIQNRGRDSLQTSLAAITRYTANASPIVTQAYQRLLQSHNQYLTDPTNENFIDWQFARNNFQRITANDKRVAELVNQYNKQLMREFENQRNLNRVFSVFSKATTTLDSTLSSLAGDIRMEYSNKARDNDNVRRNEQRNQVLFIMLAFLISNSALFFIMWNISKPINRLLHMVKEVEDGDYNVRFEYQSGNELATLGYAFNSMLNTIERDRETIQRHQNELEDKVRLRTAELESAKVQAEAASQAKSDFLAKMSHEIRTPMNGIIGTAEVLLSSGINTQQKEIVKIIQNSGNSLLEIINDILDFSKIESGKMDVHEHQFSIRRLMEIVMTHYRLEAAKKNLNLLLEIEPNLPDLFTGDENKIQRVLENIVVNAIKFTQSGEVTVSLKQDTELLGLPGVLFSVADTGIGIPANRLDCIFDSFTQVDNTATREYGGTGLGTTIARKLLELMEGKIWAESPNPDSQGKGGGAGSVFHFVLPLKQADDYCFQLNNEVSIKLRDIGFLILSTEDHIMNRFTDIFKLNGITPFRCSSTDEVMETIESFSEDDRDIIVLTDYYLDNPSQAAEVRELVKNPCLSVVAVISDIATADDGMLADIGIRHVFVPPVKQAVFLDKVSELLHDWYESRGQRQLAAVQKQLQSRALHVLLAEDNPINQKVAHKIFESIGLVVDLANNGAEAVEKVMQTTYDLVFMDIQMPVLNGLDATKQIREQGHTLPIIAMTANAMSGDREDCLRQGMNDYLSKPITFNSVTDVVRKWTVHSSSDADTDKFSRNKCKDKEVSMQYPILDEQEAINRVYDKDLLKELLVDFSTMKELDWSVFDRHLSDNNVVEMEHLSHAIKGVAGNLALTGIYKTSTALNDALKLAQHDRIDELYNELKAEVVRFREYLPTYLNT